MTSSAQYQHLSKSLLSVSHNIETIYRSLENCLDKIKSLEAKTGGLGPAPVSAPVPIPAPTSGRPSFYVSGPDSVVIDLANELPKLPEVIFITMVGAGGAGGSGYIENDNAYSGGGGGAGETVHKYILSMKGSTGKLFVTAGLGGDNVRPDGSDSSVEVEMIDSHRRIVTASGGHGANTNPNLGGQGSCNKLHDFEQSDRVERSDRIGLFSGKNGSDGQIQFASDPMSIQGGKGGNSYFAAGGCGGYSHYIKDTLEKTVLNPQGEDGSFGSGGGGSAPGLSKDLVGKGGHGFVLIEYS
jgi:hypothetical protein